MNASERRQRLRAILASDKCVFAAPVHDPISARIADHLGFEVGFTVDRVIPGTMGFPPDCNLMTMTEQAQHYRDMCRASDLSLVASVHEGYGHALNMMRTVEEMENAGVSAIKIKDNEVALRFGDEGIPSPGLPRGKSKEREPHGLERLTPLKEMVGKLKAAVAARQDPSLVIVAQTYAKYSVVDGDKDPMLTLSEVTHRMKAYEETGVDVIFPTSHTLEEVEMIQGATKLPLMGGHRMAKQVVGAGSQQEALKYFASKGFRVVNPAHLTMWAEMKAVYEVLKGLRDGTPIEQLFASSFVPEVELQAVIRRSHYDELVKTFMA